MFVLGSNLRDELRSQGCGFTPAQHKSADRREEKQQNREMGHEGTNHREEEEEEEEANMASECADVGCVIRTCENQQITGRAFPALLCYHLLRPAVSVRET